MSNNEGGCELIEQKCMKNDFISELHTRNREWGTKKPGGLTFTSTAKRQLEVSEW